MTWPFVQRLSQTRVRGQYFTACRHADVRAPEIYTELGCPQTATAHTSVHRHVRICVMPAMSNTHGRPHVCQLFSRYLFISNMLNVLAVSIYDFESILS
jgi:hypothetical protein